MPCVALKRQWLEERKMENKIENRSSLKDPSFSLKSSHRQQVASLSRGRHSKRNLLLFQAATKQLFVSSKSALKNTRHVNKRSQIKWQQFNVTASDEPSESSVINTRIMQQSTQIEVQHHHFMISHLLQTMQNFKKRKKRWNRHFSHSISLRRRRVVTLSIFPLNRNIYSTKLNLR